MNKQRFLELTRTKLLILDGATGTELILRGMPQGVCPEQWIINNPDAILDIQRNYRQAGSDVVYAPTFGGNRFKLEEFGLANELVPINSKLVELSRQAAGDGGVFGDLAPTGQFIHPLGDLSFSDAVNAFKEQANVLLDAGVDGFVIETMMDIQETRAALLAVREICDLPVMVSMTFGQDGRTLTGTDPVTALLTLQAIGIDAFGCNCSTGPEDMLDVIRQLKPHATVPLMAKPNAGIPKLENGKTVFSMQAEAFSKFVPEFIQAGINIMGGCCGTTPEHIRQLTKQADGLPLLPPRQAPPCAVTSPRNTVLFDDDTPAAIVGSLIDASHDQVLREELNQGKLIRLRDLAREQTDLMVDVVALEPDNSAQPRTIREAASAPGTILPLMFDLKNTDGLESILQQYPGIALMRLNLSDTAITREVVETTARYGTVFLISPDYPDQSSITVEGTKASIRSALHQLSEQNIPTARTIIECPVLLPTNKSSVEILLASISFCRDELQLPVACNFSQVSSQNTEPEYAVNTFISMAVDRGINALIMDPRAELLTATVFAANALTARDRKMMRYVKKFSAKQADTNEKSDELSPADQVARCVIQGDDETIGITVRKALEADIAPKTLVDDYLIPAINQVGDFFDRKEYFLPQLIMSADAMRKAFDILEPLLLREQAGDQAQKETVILATVKGDIHDIGKNIVAIMMRNYNFEVIDLGKDVKPELILDTAAKHGTELIGLSALMTTTMTEMKQVIDMARARGMSDLKFMIGGAVVDQNYADEIGAQGYAGDAMEAVRLAQKLSQV